MSVSGTQPDSPVGGDGVETGAGSAAPGLTGAILPESRYGSGNDGSGGLRAELVRTFATHRAGTFEELAQALLDAGWVRVSVDDDTVERVARALFGDFDGIVDGMAWDEDSEESREAYRSRARAAVQALRDGSGTQDARCQGCGGPLSEGSHGMSEFGGCV